MAPDLDPYAVLGVSRDASPRRSDGLPAAGPGASPRREPGPRGRGPLQGGRCGVRDLSDPARRRQYDLFGDRRAGGFPFGDVGDLFDVFFGRGRWAPAPAGLAKPCPARRGPSRRHRPDVRAGGVRRRAGCGHPDPGGLRGAPGSGPSPEPHPRCTRCGGTGELQDLARSLFGTVMTARPCPQCDGSGEEIVAPCNDMPAEVVFRSKRCRGRPSRGERSDGAQSPGGGTRAARRAARRPVLPSTWTRTRCSSAAVRTWSRCRWP